MKKGDLVAVVLGHGWQAGMQGEILSLDDRGRARINFGFPHGNGTVETHKLTKLLRIGMEVMDGFRFGNVVCREWLRKWDRDILTGYYILWEDKSKPKLIKVPYGHRMAECTTTNNGWK